MSRKETAVLIHGCHLGADEWENIVWGDPENGIWGRASRGLQIALQEDAGLVIWGTGASQRDGIKESEYTYKYAFERFASCPVFPRNIKVTTNLMKCSVIDEESQNTREEIQRAADLCSYEDEYELILVSSPTHIARCLQEATTLRLAGDIPNIKIVAVASDTCYAGSTPKDVFIMEPPHRGDRSKAPMNQTLQRMKPIRRDKELYEAFHTDLQALLATYEAKL